MPPQSVRFFIASMVALGNGRGWGCQPPPRARNRATACSAVFPAAAATLFSCWYCVVWAETTVVKSVLPRVVLLKRQLGGAPGGFGGLLEQGQALAGTDEGTHGVLGFLQCL